MKIVFTKYGEQDRVYIVNAVRCSSLMIIFDIVGVGWRSLLHDQYDGYTITNNDTE